MTWGYVAVGAGTLIGGYLSGQGAKKAAGQQSAADIAAQQTQQKMFDTIVGQEQPFLKTGYGAAKNLNELMGYFDTPFKMTNAQLQRMPGYQFQLKQGDRALQSSDAATVGALSGPAMKDLINFNQGLASSYENQYFNQYQTQQNNIFNRLSQIASLGQNAAGNLGSQGASLGTGIAQAQAAQGAATAAGTIGAANAYGGAASNIPLYALLANKNPGG